MTLARTERSRRHLIKQFEEHTLVKRYLAVVAKGAPDWTRPRAPFTVMRRLADGQTLPADASFVLIGSEGTEFVLDGYCSVIPRIVAAVSLGLMGSQRRH